MALNYAQQWSPELLEILIQGTITSPFITSNVKWVGARTFARMVSIRTEEDEEMLKHFTPEQRRIRCEWRNRTAAKVSIKDRDVFLEQMKQAFITMAGGGANGGQRQHRRDWS